MTSENQYNSVVGDDIFVVSDSSFLKTRKAKALYRRFVDLENEWKKWKPERLIRKAWYIYLVQILKDIVFDDSVGTHVSWVPNEFCRLPFDSEEDGPEAFRMFLGWFTGECAGDVYKMDEDTPETVQAGMYEVAKDWFKYQKKEKRNG